jgi:hypothetical protein
MEQKSKNAVLSDGKNIARKVLAEAPVKKTHPLGASAGEYPGVCGSLPMLSCVANDVRGDRVAFRHVAISCWRGVQ